MKRKLFFSISFSLVFLLTGCSHFDSIKMKDQGLSNKSNSTSTVVYSKSFFQERFMGREIHYQFIGGPLLQYSTMSHEKREGARFESGDFEKLLGDFDVASYFDVQFKKNIGKAKLLKIVFEKDSEKATRIIEFIGSDKKDEKTSGNTFKPNTPLAAFKVSYGLAVRPGTEQIGLRKYYRPFIRLIGRIKITGSNEVIWQNKLIAYGNKQYLGSDADASKIDKDELILAYQQVTAEVIDMVIKSLNGEGVGDLIDLQGANKADNTF
jgi:hypothetical protein